jgi:hypothetical protein
MSSNSWLFVLGSMLPAVQFPTSLMRYIISSLSRMTSDLRHCASFQYSIIPAVNESCESCLMRYVFRLSLFMIFYVYVEYPLLAAILAHFVNKQVKKAALEPFVILAGFYPLPQGLEHTLRRFYSLNYFLFLNLATGHALVKFLVGHKQVNWTPRKG